MTCRELPEIYVLRHGQTEWNAAGRMQGRLNSPLTETGRMQARAQQEILKSVADGGDFDFYCSPLGRTRETAAIAFDGLNAPVCFDGRLVEVSVGALEGLTMTDMQAQWPDILENHGPQNWHFFAPGGESFDDICGRVESWLNDLSGPAIVVTHGITSRVIRGLALGLDMNSLAELPGGQGVVYSVKDRAHRQVLA